MTITQKRLNKYSVVHYYGETENTQPVIFWKEAENITSLGDLAGKTVSVESGSCQDELLQKYPDVNAKYLNKAIDIILEIKNNRADAALIDPDILPIFLKKFPEIKVVNVKMPKSEYRYGLGILLRKDDAVNTSVLKESIAKLKKDGTINNLALKWEIQSD